MELVAINIHSYGKPKMRLLSKRNERQMLFIFSVVFIKQFRSCFYGILTHWLTFNNGKFDDSYGQSNESPESISVFYDLSDSQCPNYFSALLSIITIMSSIQFPFLANMKHSLTSTTGSALRSTHNKSFD